LVTLCRIAPTDDASVLWDFVSHGFASEIVGGADTAGIHSSLPPLSGIATAVIEDRQMATMVESFNRGD